MKAVSAILKHNKIHDKICLHYVAEEEFKCPAKGEFCVHGSWYFVHLSYKRMDEIELNQSQEKTDSDENKENGIANSDLTTNK